MLMLQIYKKSSDALGPDEIGTKILPSIIPLLVSTNLSKHQFQEIMSAVRSLLDKIEASKLSMLPDAEPKPDAEDPFNQESKPMQLGTQQTKEKDDDLDFLSDPLSSNTLPKAPVVNSDPFSQAAPKNPAPIATSTAPKSSDPFGAALAKPSGFTPSVKPSGFTPSTFSAPKPAPASASADPFASISSNIDTSSMFANLGGSTNPKPSGGFDGADPFASAIPASNPAPASQSSNFQIS